mgnify:CR=1 FL=1
MNIKPLADRVLILPQAAEEKTISGIIIPDTAKEKPLQGEVVAVGGSALETLSFAERYFGVSHQARCRKTILRHINSQVGAQVSVGGEQQRGNLAQ